MRYLNLVGEMAKRRVTNADVSRLLGIHANTVYNKLNGESTFSVDEAIQIRGAFFPEQKIEDLFQTEEKGE